MLKRPWLLSLVVFAGACDCDGGVRNRGPVAMDLALETEEDTPEAFTFEATDADGDPLTYQVSPPSHGTVTGTAPAFTYTPEADYAGADAFEITVSDGTTSAVAIVDVTVTPVNDAPLAADDSASTDENTDVVIAAADLLANDGDVDSATLTITAVGDATDGSVGLVGTDITFSPTAGFDGNATFTYTVSDGALTDTATVTVAVGAANDSPVAVDDSSSTNEDTQLDLAVATLLANDTDVDGDTLSVVSVQDAVGGTVSLTGGVVAFVPSPDTHGSASFTYTVSDGAANATATVSITVNPVNDAPVAMDDSATTNEDEAVFIDATTLLANDTDVDGPSITVVAADQATNGTLVLDANGVTFTPAADFSGTASFRYTVSDGAATATATVQIEVGAVNDAPVASDDMRSTPEDVALVLADSDLLSNDGDVDSAMLTVVGVGNAVGGSVSLAGGSITFTPTANASGTASFQYEVSDGSLSAFATVYVEVTAVNDAPVAVDDTANGTRDQALVLAASSLLANDTDIDGPGGLAVVAVSGAVNGTVSLSGSDVVFTPTAGFTGTASFDYTVSDGIDTDVAVVTVSIAQGNRAPVATNQFVDIRLNSPVAITLTATDPDMDTLSFTVVTAPTHGTLTGSGAEYTYTPNIGYVGADTFEFRANDGSLDSNVATVDITVNDPVCGDSTEDGGELCDDGNLVSGDGNGILAAPDDSQTSPRCFACVPPPGPFDPQ